MQRKIRLALALAIAAAATAAQAHNVWLKPSSTVLSKSEWVTVDAAVSNDLFFFNHRPLAIEQLVITAPDGSKLVPVNASKGELRTTFDFKPEQPGTYQLAIVSGGVNGMFKDAAGQPKRVRGTADEVQKQIPADATDVRISEGYSRIETYVTVGKPTAVKPSGKGLELVPVTHFNDLVAGEEASFVLHLDGKPAEGVEVELIAGGTRYRDAVNGIKLVTDGKGQLRVTFPSAGMWWLEASINDNKTSTPLAKERRSSYVGTFEVLP